MSIGHPIPEIHLFQNLTLKIQGQGNGWGQSLKSQCESNILSTHILFVPCQSVIPFLRYNFFKIWPWKSKVNVMGEGKVEIITWVQHSIHSHPFHSMSIGHPIPEIRLFQNLTLKIQGQGQGWGQSWKSQSGCNILSIQISFSFHVNRPFHSRDTAFPKFDLKNPRSRSNNMMLHNYRSRQFHRTWNGINPSSGFRDMGSATSGPSAACFDNFGPLAKPIWGK